MPGGCDHHTGALCPMCFWLWFCGVYASCLLEGAGLMLGTGLYTVQVLYMTVFTAWWCGVVVGGANARHML